MLPSGVMETGAFPSQKHFHSRFSGGKLFGLGSQARSVSGTGIFPTACPSLD